MRTTATVIAAALLLPLVVSACKTVRHEGELYGAGATNAAGDVVVGTDREKVEK